MNKIFIKDLRLLPKRINYFLKSEKYNRKEVFNVLKTLSLLGNVAIFGGMLRDLCLGGNYKFRSDIDLVIDTDDENALFKNLKVFSLEFNSFGGYRISLSKWKLDIWQLSKTWAFREGYVKNVSFDNLIKTTFFNWDAIVFVQNSNKIYGKENYLETLKSRVLDINLEPNPNPLGAVVRSLRYLIRENAILSPRLTNYIVRTSQLFNSSDLIVTEKERFNGNSLNETLIDDILREMKENQNSNPNKPFSMATSQLALRF